MDLDEFSRTGQRPLPLAVSSRRQGAGARYSGPTWGARPPRSLRRRQVRPGLDVGTGCFRRARQDQLQVRVGGRSYRPISSSTHAHQSNRMIGIDPRGAGRSRGEPEDTWTTGTCPNFSSQIIERSRCAGLAIVTLDVGGPMDDHRGIVIFAQGETCCAVCAPRSTNQDAIESAVALLNLSKSTDWKALRGPLLDGRSNPHTCPHDQLRQHWLVVRTKA